MTGTIFDVVEEPSSGTIMDLTDKIEHIVPDEHHDENIPWYKSYASALGKGLLKGTVSLGRTMGPLQEPYDPNQINEVLDEYLPTNEGFVEGTLERGGKLFPMVAAGGGGAPSLLRTGAAAVSGEVAKEFGAPEWAQSLAELPALIAPDVTKMIQAGKKTKDILAFGRSKGMSEEELAPLVQSAKKQRLLGKVASKKGRGETAIKETKKALNELIEGHFEHPSAKTVLNEFEAGSSMEKLKNQIDKMPSVVGDLMIKDLKKLESSPKSAEDFMRFYRSINKNFGPKTKELGILKGPTVEAIEKIDKNLASDFVNTNELYSNWAEISRTLSPTLASNLIEGSKPIQLVYGLVHGATTGNFGFLETAIGDFAVRKLATELLINPRFQNLSKKMLNALEKNKFAVANNLWDVMTQEVNKVDKKSAKKMKDLDILKLFEEQKEE